MKLSACRPGKQSRKSSASSSRVGPEKTRRGLILLAAFSACAACAVAPPRVQHGDPAAEALSAVALAAPSANARGKEVLGPAVPLEQVLNKTGTFTLADAVHLALQNNPATRVAWANARAAAAGYGSARGAWFPGLDLGGSLYYEKDASTKTLPGGFIKEIGVTASLSYLLFDFGGRSGAVEDSRQSMIAAGWTRNAVLQNTVLQAETAFFNLAGAKAMLEANRTSLAEAEANLTAAEERHRMGLATIADVLQAKTAYAEVKLAVLDSEGRLRTARGALAVVMGYPANVPFEPELDVPEIPQGGLARTVDQLIEQAVASRPDLQASRALVMGSAARVREARSRLLPSVSAAASIGRQWFKDISGYTNATTALLQLQIPLFDGLVAKL